MLRDRLAPVLTLALVGACSEDPSFSVRWKLHPYIEPEALDEPEEREAFEKLRAKLPAIVSVDECTELGISRIRMITRNSAGVTVDEREFPCFPGEFTDASAVAPGPGVGPGEYSVTLTALGRRGIAFCDDPQDADDAADPLGDGIDTCTKVVASDFRKVVVRETGENQRITDFVIVGVPQCRDGVDNDRDGYTDLADPSCRGDRHGTEAGDLASAQLVVRPEFMSGNPNARCESLRLRDIDLHVSGPTSIQRRFPCTGSARTFIEDLLPGDYQVAVTGIGYDGELRAIAEVDPELASFTLAPAGFQTVVLPADFTIAAFVAPLEERFFFSLQYPPAVPDGLPEFDCQPTAGSLTLDRVRVRFLEGGQPAPRYVLPQPAAGKQVFPPAPQFIIGQVTELPCEEFLKTYPTNIVRWDADAPESYRDLAVVVEVFPPNSDTPCFGNADNPEPAAPNADFVVELTRLSDQGACADDPQP